MLAILAIALLIIYCVFSLRNKDSRKPLHICILIFLVVLACYNPHVETYNNMNSYILEAFTLREPFDTNTSGTSEEEEEDSDLAHTAEHIELAYKLCSDPNTNKNQPGCHSFRTHLDALKKSYKRLKKSYCSEHSHVCEELGI